MKSRGCARPAKYRDVWLIADVQEQDLGLIRAGEKAQAHFVAFPGKSFDGTVEFIYPSLSPETRTARVRIVIPNPDAALRAAMYASVEIAVPAADKPMLAVPISAVIDSGARQVVLIDRGDGRFEPRPVRLGTQDLVVVAVKEPSLQGFGNPPAPERQP